MVAECRFAGPGGLWVTGDKVEGLSRLRWIVGKEAVARSSWTMMGESAWTEKLLAGLAGLGASRVEDSAEDSGLHFIE